MLNEIRIFASVDVKDLFETVFFVVFFQKLSDERPENRNHGNEDEKYGFE